MQRACRGSLHLRRATSPFASIVERGSPPAPAPSSSPPPPSNRNATARQPFRVSHTWPADAGRDGWGITTTSFRRGGLERGRATLKKLGIGGEWGESRRTRDTEKEKKKKRGNVFVARIISRPPLEHPKRPSLCFAYTRFMHNGKATCARVALLCARSSSGDATRCRQKQ